MQGHPAFELDWNLVRTYVAVAQAGSLARGAKSLGISHPTAARHIQQLEEALGLALFSRTAQGLLLNEAGQALLDTAQVMHKNALELRAVSDSFRAAPVTRVRVSVAEILAEMLPDVMLTEMGASAADTVAIDMLVTDDSLNLLKREADIALRHARPEQQGLICRRVGALEMGIFARRDYASRFGNLTADNLDQHRFIDGLTHDHFLRGAARRGLVIDADNVVLRSDSIACRRAAVRAGWGIGAFPVWMAEQEPGWQSVFAMDEVIDLEVWLVARPEVRDSHQMQALFSRLGESLAARIEAADPATSSAA